jgi:hypothetical protein
MAEEAKWAKLDWFADVAGQRVITFGSREYED